MGPCSRKKAAFEGHRRKAKCPKRGGLSRAAEAQDGVNLGTSNVYLFMIRYCISL